MPRPKLPEGQRRQQIIFELRAENFPTGADKKRVMDDCLAFRGLSQTQFFNQQVDKLIAEVMEELPNASK